MKRSIALVVILSVILGTWTAGAAATATVKLSVKVSAAGGKDVPVSAAVDLPAGLANTPVEKIVVSVSPEGGGPAAPGQIVRDGGQAQLWWVLPEAAPGASEWTAALAEGRYEGKDVFAFADTPGKHLDLRFGGKPVARYMYEYDTSTPEKAFETYKVYHHVFDAEGKDVITKGAPGHDPHHRGIYIGWNNLTFGGKGYDFWSMKSGVQVHRKFLSMTAGPVLGRSTALIEWVADDGKVIVSEERTTTCFRQGPGAIVLLEFATKIKAVAGAMALNGNPEHGGMQYRAHDEVANNVGAVRGKQTADTAPEELKTRYEFHKDGIKTEAQKLNENADLPWAAQSCSIRGKRYCVQHMNHTSNPKGTIYSAYRQYGRFGAFFVRKLEAGEVLPLRYRIYAAESPMLPRAEMNLRHAAFNTPPAVKVGG